MDQMAASSPAGSWLPVAALISAIRQANEAMTVNSEQHVRLAIPEGLITRHQVAVHRPRHPQPKAQGRVVKG
jgi:hypothetical protein